MMPTPLPPCPHNHQQRLQIIGLLLVVEKELINSLVYASCSAQIVSS